MANQMGTTQSIFKDKTKRNIVYPFDNLNDADHIKHYMKWDEAARKKLHLEGPKDQYFEAGVPIGLIPGRGEFF